MRTPAAALLLALLAASCKAGGEAPPTLQQGARRANEARLVRQIEGFAGPESVRYDPELDVYFVSSMRGFGSFHDNNGYITRVAGDLGSAELFAAGGLGGVTLHAPKGMALRGDTLWVADIDALRGFDRRSGAPVATVDLRGRVMMLNDVALGPDGAIYVTDSGIQMLEHGVVHRGGDKVLRVARGERVSVVASGEALARPNGITWDARAGRWLVASFNPFRSHVYSLAAGGELPILATGAGEFDGLEVLDDGTVLVTSWSDSSLHAIRDGEDRRIVRGLVQPADIGIDTRRRRVAVPQVLLGRVGFYELPRE